MRLIKADANRCITLAGVTQPVPRPVDIEAAQTGLRILRTLRIYRFPRDIRIEGHAEEDEVFIVVLDGAIELVIRAPGCAECHFALAAPGHGTGQIACAAYLPVRGEYLLRTRAPADVAYARATPNGTRLPASFATGTAPNASSQPGVMLDLRSHAERLRLQLLEGPERGGSWRTELFEGGACSDGALLHVRTQEAGGSLAIVANAQLERLQSWDTVAIEAGERAALESESATGFVGLLVWGE